MWLKCLADAHQSNETSYHYNILITSYTTLSNFLISTQETVINSWLKIHKVMKF